MHHLDACMLESEVHIFTGALFSEHERYFNTAVNLRGNVSELKLVQQVMFSKYHCNEIIMIYGHCCTFRNISTYDF